MILYSDDTSPYCAPVRAAIYAKQLAIEIVPPPGGLKSEEYRALSGTGTIPSLALDDGFVLPESTVILAYLDDRFPERPLLPATPEGRARALLLVRLGMDGVVGAPDLVTRHPKLSAYFGRVSQHPAVAKVLGELQAALASNPLPF